MMKCIYMLLLLSPLGVCAQQIAGDTLLGKLKDCDLFFQVAGSRNAITDVTEGVGMMDIEHVGVYACVEGRHVVIEALPCKGVCVTPVDSFLLRNMSSDMIPLVVVGRVAEGVDVKKSLANVLGYVGCDYDSLYLPDNEEIYCSELVQKSFVDGDGEELFTTIPMTFRDSKGEIPEYWTDFYSRCGIPVPEGMPGTNPGEMSRRKNIRIIFSFIEGKECPSAW